MKKSILLILSATAIFCQSVKSQDKKVNDNKARFAIQAGPNINKFTGKSPSGKTLSNDFIIGSHAGFNLEIPVRSDFYLQPGLSVTNTGTKNKQSTYTATTTLHSVEMPIGLIFKPAVGHGRLITGLRIEASYSLSGKCSIDGNVYNVIDRTPRVKFKNTVTRNEASPDDVLYLKPLDLSASFLAGYEFNKGLFFQFELQHGFLNKMPNYEYGTDANKMTISSLGIGLSIGFRFK